MLQRNRAATQPWVASLVRQAEGQRHAGLKRLGLVVGPVGQVTPCTDGVGSGPCEDRVSGGGADVRDAAIFGDGKIEHHISREVRG